MLESYEHSRNPSESVADDEKTNPFAPADPSGGANGGDPLKKGFADAKAANAMRDVMSTFNQIKNKSTMGLA